MKVNLILLDIYQQDIVRIRAVASSIIGGGGGLIFIYSCSQTIKTIDFKRN